MKQSTMGSRPLSACSQTSMLDRAKEYKQNKYLAPPNLDLIEKELDKLNDRITSDIKIQKVSRRDSKRSVAAGSRCNCSSQS
jgi:hypothetical protein